MTSLQNFQSSAADWRKQLQVNDQRTRVVIFLFLLIYVGVGIIVDLYFRENLYSYPLAQRAYFLVTFQVIPWGTIILAAIAGLSIFVTFSLADKIMMLGTDYYELNPQTARSLTEQQLYNIIDELKIAAGLRYMPKVYIIEADYMNAFASGYSEKSAMVAITRGLLEKLKRSEIQAVMAHELSHIRHHDIKLTLFAVVLSNIMIIVIDMLFSGIIYGGGERRRRDRDGEGSGRSSSGLAVIVILLRYLLPLITVILLMYLSRTREFMADAGSVELVRDNTPLANALIKISQDAEANQELYTKEYNSTSHENLRLAAYIFDPTVAGIKIKQATSSLLSSHPSLEERLKALGFKQIS